MKKLLIIFMLAALSVAGMATSTKKGAIAPGNTMLSKPMAFTAADSIAGNGGFHIVTSDSLIILISNPQKYLQYQTFSTTIAYYTGAHAVTIKAYGKVTSSDSWHPIGSTVTWTSTSSNPGLISGTTPTNYNYFRISYICSGATQNVVVTAFEARTANVFPYAAVTTTGAFTNTVTGTLAAGTKAINTSITQNATALTGNLIAGEFDATNGTSAATGGVIYGIEAKARAATPANAGNTIGRLDGVYASVDAKNKTATIMRAFEASLDGAAGGASTEAVAFEAFNNSSATQTASYAFSANGGTASGHKTYTHDIRLQNGEFIDNTCDGSITVPNIIRKHTPVAVNATATLSAANMLNGVISCTSASAVAMTTPTATAIAALIPGCGAGTAFDLIIDNTASSSSGVVTLTLDGSITVVNPAIITGGATLTLAIATTGKFSFYFTSATAARCYRVY
jgi:hypothetical protein